MDINTLTQLIGALGFPISACIALFWYLNKERESHHEEMQSMTHALNQNTNVLTELKTFLEVVTRSKDNDNRSVHE